MKKILLFFILLAGLNLYGVVLVDIVNMHGFISQGFYKSSANNIYGNSKDGSYRFNEIGMNFSANFNENFRAGLQFIYRDLTDRNAKVGIDWAFGDFRLRDWIGLRAGIIKMPLGLYNEVRDIDKLRTFVFLPQSIYNENWRDSFKSIEGLSLYGNFSVPVVGDFSYQLQNGLLSIPPNGRLAKESAFGIVNITDVKEKISSVANLQWTTPLDNLSFNFSWVNMDFQVYGYNRHIPSESINPYWDTDIYTYSLKFEPGNFTIVAELSNYDLNVSGFEFTNPENGQKVAFEPFVTQGYYGSLAYRFTDWLEVGTYYSEFYFDKDDKEGNKFAQMGMPNFRAYSKDFDITTNFIYNKNLGLKLELHKLWGVAGTFPDENPDYKSDWYLFALKVSYSI